MIELREQSLLVTGPLTLETVPALANGISEHLAKGANQVDLSAVDEVDSSAVALLLEWQRQARERGVTLQCRGLPSALKNLADLYGVTGLVDPAT